MATSTNIQFLGEGATLGDSSNSTIESFYFTGAIVAGDWVAFDPAIADFDVRVKTVHQSDDGDVVSLHGIVGVALESVDASLDTNYNGNKVKVCIAGGPVLANVDAAVVAGDLLVGSTAVGGQAEPAVQADTDPFPLICGVALEAEAGGFARVLVKRNLL